MKQQPETNHLPRAKVQKTSPKLTVITPHSKQTVVIDFPQLIPTAEGEIIRKSAYKFRVKKDTQNIFIELSDLNADYDLYLSPSEGVEHDDKGHIKIQSIYANSTNFGTNREVIFAQLPKGNYYLNVKPNFGSQTLKPEQKPTGTLTFNSKYFTNKLAKIPNDPLLNSQWYLFNKGYYLFDNRNAYILDSLNNTEADGIIPNADIAAPEAWKTIHSASNVVVAVIDTGIDIDHPDLKDNIWINKDEIPGNGEDDDGNGKTDDIYGWNVVDNTNNIKPKQNWKGSSHGTHVAGTIGASGNNGIGISGVAWDVQIMPIQTEADHTGWLLNTNKGIRYAAKNNADIANMSFGMSIKRNPAELMLFMTADGALTKDSPESIQSLLKNDIKAFRYAKKSDMLLVVAAGNDGSRADALAQWTQIGSNDQSLSPNNFLAYFYDNVISVGSSDGMNQLSPFTNTGITTDLVAPGGNTKEASLFGILSTVPSGSKQLTDKGLRNEFKKDGLDGENDATWPDWAKYRYDKNMSSFVEDSEGFEYQFSQGTSMAAPVTSGAAALIKAANPDLTAPDIRRVLLASARRNPKLKGLAGQNGLQLNLEEAVKLAEVWEGHQSHFEINEGTDQDDQLNATPNNTWLRGQEGDDLLRGNHGNDQLEGGRGDDVLIPGEGLDDIIGGHGSDIIRYFHRDESPIARPDKIRMASNDQIDLSALDGQPLKPGVQKLKLIENNEFSGESGELMARRNGIFVDLNGDAFADFGILFSKQLDFDLTSDHFIL